MCMIGHGFTWSVTALLLLAGNGLLLTAFSADAGKNVSTGEWEDHCGHGAARKWKSSVRFGEHPSKIKFKEWIANPDAVLSTTDVAGDLEDNLEDEEEDNQEDDQEDNQDDNDDDDDSDDDIESL
jgi:hypothetical protein